MNPETLLEEQFRLTAPQKKALKKLGLSTVRDLLFHFPRSYQTQAEIKYIRGLKAGDHATLYGRIVHLKTTKAFRTKIPMTKAIIEDATGKLPIVWFHQPYIGKMIQEGSSIQLTGKIAENKSGLYLANPNTEHSYSKNTNLFSGSSSPKEVVSLEPSYPESQGITSRWFYYTLKKIFAEYVHETIEDPLPENIIKKYKLPSLKTALVWVHAPQKERDALSARKRFSFEEVFFIQLERQKARREFQNHPSYKVKTTKKSTDEFTKRFPFSLTKAQQHAIHTILSDFKKEKPMSRLLEGDVGSGKTAVAAVTTYAVATSRPSGQDFGNLQIALMAPTEILAKQHFESLIEYFAHKNEEFPMHIGLITGSGCRKFPSKVAASFENSNGSTDISRTQLLKWAKNGEIPIVVGTHALIQKTVAFKHLAYVIIDEQHRFGTRQRYTLVRKDDSAPHLLSMTATPIPRTLALTIYGDLDLTLLDEMPPGRKKIITELVGPKMRDQMYEKIKAELKKGRQVYIICPKIDVGAGKLEVKNVTDEAKRLEKEIFPDHVIEILHSKLKPKEKEGIMAEFISGKINILVATSVVEVGVNVPNATSIIIEGADRFGLAQLHQLRGRVLRSTEQAYCYLLSDSKSENSLKRLKTLVDAKNGFELAEKDLMLRGAGELSGKKQWGITDIGMEAIKNLKMVEAARTEAEAILDKDVSLKKHPLLRKRIEENSEEIHFE